MVLSTMSSTVGSVKHLSPQVTFDSSLAFSANSANKSTTTSTTQNPPLTVASTSNLITTILPDEDSASHVLTYVFVPIGSIILVILLAGLIIFLVRKKRLDKLRHHLMPLYNFDPTEEGEDWESELLEDGMDHRMTAHMKMRVETPSPNDEPKLMFDREARMYS